MLPPGRSLALTDTVLLRRIPIPIPILPVHRSSPISTTFTPAKRPPRLPISLRAFNTSTSISSRRSSMSSTAHIYAGDAGGVGDDVKASGDQTVKLTSHHQYTVPPLDRGDLDPNPLTQFNKWFKEVLSLRPPLPGHAPVPRSPDSPTVTVREPEAMALSTVSSEGIPSTRIVLLKTVDTRGFVFFTNYSSRKSRELAGNGHASIAIYWKELSRQVRAVGKVERVSREESEEYFRTRPRGSQLGAWASEQSKEVEEEEVGRKVQELDDEWKLKEGKEVKCPEHWGGWRIVPFEVEFWVGQPSRLHDRFRYTRPREGESTEWKVARLAP